MRSRPVRRGLTPSANSAGQSSAATSAHSASPAHPNPRPVSCQNPLKHLCRSRIAYVPYPTCAGSIATWRPRVRADHASAVLVGSCAAKPSLVRGMPAAEDEGKDRLPLMALLASEHGLLIPSSFFTSVTASCKLRPRRVARAYMLALY